MNDIFWTGFHDELEKIALLDMASGAAAGARSAGKEDRGRGALYGTGAGILGGTAAIPGVMQYHRTGGKKGLSVAALGAVGGGAAAGHFGGRLAKKHGKKKRKAQKEEISRQVAAELKKRKG